ncbi:PDR/VanB family oxidoreductase [Xenophilus sp. Marseille-Q4582]|uniref:PDR/VanB family oxidoreductase n=1 Tax=Xenophilus sp. Marseille-Q4582 TaxID=2866600 RepID=UPI001CE48930|nr:PDR/VanB family oxidoreductase [Xenophilus sp. Marseille-Q4582]
MTQTRILTLRVSRLTRETPEILGVELTHPWGRALPAYEAGAHIDLHLPGGFSRQYSLAQAPHVAGNRYVIGVKRESASRGGSASVHGRLREGDLLPVGEPRNTFALAEGAAHHLLLAGGIGMTPLLAMAQTLAARGERFTLCVFARSPEHLAFAGSLRDSALAPHVRLHFDEGGTPAQKLSLPELLAAPAPGTHLYLCGPAGFMQAVRDAAKGWPEDNIHAEYFAAPDGGVATSGKPFMLNLLQRGIRVPVAGEQTAVEALHDVGIDIPVSCQQGLCGTCVVPAEGETAEHRDFCLSGSERRHKVALCCSRARGEELALHI